MTLMGLISKHGILIVEFANELQQPAVQARAVIDAAAIRLRPILMTTAAMVLGVIPLITAAARARPRASTWAWSSPAASSIGTLFTLFVVPAFYMLLAADQPAAIVTRDASNLETSGEPRTEQQWSQ